MTLAAYYVCSRVFAMSVNSGLRSVHSALSCVSCVLSSQHREERRSKVRMEMEEERV